MIIEVIKSRLIRLSKFGKSIRTIIRYKAITGYEFVKASLKRVILTSGRETASLTVGIGRGISNFTIKSTNALMENKRKVLMSAVGMCACLFCGLCVFNAVTAYEYSYNGQVLGIVEEADSVYNGIRQAEETLTETIGAQVVIDEDEDIEVKRIIKDTADVSEEEDVVNALTSINEIKVLSYAINITGTVDEETDETTTKAIYLGTKEQADEVLESIKSEYSKDIDSEELLEVTFEESVTVEEAKASIDDIVDTKSAIETINTGGVEEKTHVVKEGDSVSSVASKYGVGRKSLKKWNPDIGDDNILYLNQKIQLQEQKPLLNVIIKKNVTFTEDFGPEIEYDDTDNLYKGQEIVTKKGKSGNRTVNADIIEKNGEQVKRVDLSYTVHKEQKTRKVMRGTKERPDTIGEGYYYYPMKGGFSSPFGSRWGRTHEGIDIRGPIGTDINAADAGVVTEAGATSNGYGIAVKIDHGNGRTTYYAHNSEVLVKVGDIVYRGQHIAESGNTGNSTGPHLHFETRFNGVAKDPMKYCKTAFC